MKSVINHHIFGEIVVSQTWRARRISLSVRPPGKIRLSLPYNVPLSEALHFVEEKRDWIDKALENMASRHPSPVISMPYATHSHTLKLTPADTDTIKAKIGGGEIRVTYPLYMSHDEEEVQKIIKKGIEEAWRIEAKEYLPQRVAELSKQFGLRYRTVTVRNTVSKWGSCSSANDLSLSLHLMRLPHHLIDYILTHELCHIVHKNHGPKFHKLLDTLTSGCHQALNREMKQFHTRW